MKVISNESTVKVSGGALHYPDGCKVYVSNDGVPINDYMKIESIVQNTIDNKITTSEAEWQLSIINQNSVNAFIDNYYNFNNKSYKVCP